MRGPFITAVFYHYARLRIWMERAPRQERWRWYGVLASWFYTAGLVV